MDQTTPDPRTRPYAGPVPAAQRDGKGIPEPIFDELNTAPPSYGKDELRPGARIGRYIVQRKLGRGGMGIVYGAIDPDLERRVAIKLVRARDDDHFRRFSTRLRREAQALARLVHPNIVALYDIALGDQGAYMAMEYLPGRDLRRWLDKEDPPWTEIVDVFLQAGKGLAAAHAAGLVHRDFKPTNVMVCGDGRVKVLDFGLAYGTPTLDPWLTTSRNGAEKSLLSRKVTRDNVVLGTAGYMSPEQLMTDLPVGPRSDQFSFCVALFEALYGIRPYAGRDPVEMAASFTEGRRRDPPDRRGVPKRIERAILRGLSIDPGERFSHLELLLDELRWRPRQRWRSVAGAVALISTACLSAAATMWLGGRPAPGAAATTVCAATSPGADTRRR